MVDENVLDCAYENEDYVDEKMLSLILETLKIDEPIQYIPRYMRSTTIADMACMVAEKIADGKIKVVFDIPKDNTFGYAADAKMRLNSDKLQALGWLPQIGLEEAYRRMLSSMQSTP